MANNNPSARRKKKRKLNIKRTSIFILTLIAVIGGVFFVITNASKINILTKNETAYLAANTNEVTIYSLNEEVYTEAKKLSRGTQISINKKNKTEDDLAKTSYFKVTIDKEEYYIKDENIVYKKEEAVKEKEIYVRTASTIYEKIDSSKITGLAKKGEKLEIIGYDKLNSDGKVNMYNIKQGEVLGHVYGKYMEYTEEIAKANYNAEVNDPIHSRIKNTYGGGNAINLDFYPVDKPKFENNVMPDPVYSLYLNCGTNVINNVDAYIEFAKGTKINAFVVDVKDNQSSAFHSKVMEEMSPTSYKNAINENDKYKLAITKLKEAGFYVIGRITTFKDSYYITDHPEDAIASKSSGNPYLHQGAYWPSPYSRNVWYYNIELAKEAVTEFGFNEIQFDYVRFPDRLQGVEASINMKNAYNEEKAEAIQRYLTYAAEELHKLNVYISADVFGESTNGNYTTAYGQYWPAISNVVDAISGMPYPDHFSSGYYGLKAPWNAPYELMKAWATEASKRQAETTSPAVGRTWIQAYKVMSHVDPNGLDYNAADVKKEINGLFDGGLTGGYITWLSSSSLDKYRLQKDAYATDYKKGN